ncbi:MAG TPA: hypothetical protein VFZ76_10200 [Anaerolineales bacterium]
MSQKSNTVVRISIILVLLLAVVGVAYTQWTQTLVLDTNVTTTGLDLSWIIIDDDGGACTPDMADPTVVHVTLDDAQISDSVHCTFRIRNDSPFEVVIVDEFIDPPIPQASGSNYCAGAPAYAGGELYVNFLNGVGTTISPASELSVAYDICVEDEAQQNTNYSFDFNVVFEQN